MVLYIFLEFMSIFYTTYYQILINNFINFKLYWKKKLFVEKKNTYYIKRNVVYLKDGIRQELFDISFIFKKSFCIINIIELVLISLIFYIYYYNNSKLNLDFFNIYKWAVALSIFLNIYSCTLDNDMVNLKIVVMILNMLNLFVVTGDILVFLLVLELTSYSVIFFFLKFILSKKKSSVGLLYYTIIINMISVVLVIFLIIFLLTKFSSTNIYTLQHFFNKNNDLVFALDIFILVILIKTGQIPFLSYNMYLYKSVSFYFIGVYNVICMYNIIILNSLVFIPGVYSISTIYIYIINVVYVIYLYNTYSIKEFLAVSSIIFYNQYSLYIIT